MNIGKRLKNYRELTEMTQQEVAQRMHITRQCLANWEIDKREPGLEQLVELCKTYGIGLRMLEPRELYGCQGFPEDYIIDRDYMGKAYGRSEQVKRCGNAVCPPIPAALVKANLPELCVAKRTGNMRIDYSKDQLSFVV